MGSDAAAPEDGQVPVDARLAALGAGPALRDPSAAARCWCSCHPRPADEGLHGGGTACPCQLTPDEHSERLARAAAGLAEARTATAGAHATRAGAVRRRADELGVEVRVASWAAPFAVTGRCDGHPFYLRERDGTFEVRVADAPGPGDLWADHDVPSSLAASGAADDLYGPDGDPAAAVAAAVVAVRRHLRARGCDHAARGAWPFCPACGTPA